MFFVCHVGCTLLDFFSPFAHTLTSAHSSITSAPSTELKLAVSPCHDIALYTSNFNALVSGLQPIEITLDVSVCLVKLIHK